MILSCGEALIDMIPTPTQDGGTGFVPHSGGAVFNTAIALGRLGVPSAFYSGISDDLFGQQLMRSLRDSHVETALITPRAQPTTLAFVQLVDGHAKYAFYDENTAGRMLDQRDLPILPDTVSTLFFGGISLVSEPAADTYAALFAAHADRCVMMMDPNIRPAFIQDAARYRARLEGMLAKSDIVKVSDEDLAWLFPDIPETARITALLDIGPQLILVTRGAEGADAYRSGRDPIHVPSQKAVVADTVGAGDTYNAGVLAHLHRTGDLTKSKIAKLDDATLIDAMRYGAMAAAITVARAGANPPWKEELTGL